MPRGERKNKVQAPYIKVPCVIGIDESYTRTGITIAVNGKIKKISSIDFKRVKTKTHKRLLLQKTLNSAINSCLKKFPPEQISVICERIRTFTGGEDLRPQVIKAHAALVAYIVDTAYVRGIGTWSVDTRVWKAAILGSSKPIFEPIEGVTNPQKFGSVRKVISLGFEEEISIYRNNRSRRTFNDDAADSACIALYGFVDKPNLIREY